LDDGAVLAIGALDEAAPLRGAGAVVRLSFFKLA
jgi:hypothetical protein